MDKEKTKSEDQAFLDADFSNIMYEKYGKKWTEYQEQEVKRIEEEQLVSR
jgi:ABC-type transporter MlaC component